MNSLAFEEFRSRMRAELGRQFGKNNLAAFWGNQNAKIVSVSQAPSISAVRNQRPFSDKSGDRLREEWYRVSWEQFYNKDNFYFTTVGLYYPGRNKKGGDKKPSFSIAQKWLWKELSYLSPKIFLVVGQVAAEFFFPGKSFSDSVFGVQKINEATTFVLPHPSPINIKWFKDHPEFEKSRLEYIRRCLHKVLD